jgi:hypothetical protein
LLLVHEEAAMSRARTVEVGWESPESEEAFGVQCSVTLGTPQPANLHHDSSWVPGDEEPTVEVLDVVEDRPGGKARPELVAVVEADFERLQVLALERALDCDDPPEDTREEQRGEV